MILSNKKWTSIYSEPYEFKNFISDVGFGWVKKYIKNSEKFGEIVKKYSLSFSNDASRRKSRFGSSFIKNVDSGFDEIPLHSESSFSPNCPEIIWFYCIKSPSYKNESTTVCDGYKVWKKLSNSTKNFLLKNPIEYKLEIELTSKMQDRKWFINRIGCGDAKVKDNKICFTSRQFAVNEITNSKGGVYLSFANHLFVAAWNKESQILSGEINSKPLPIDLVDECKEICEGETLDILWETGDFIFINNKRFMHGRRAISKDSKRDIVVSQTEKTNYFPSIG